MNPRLIVAALLVVSALRAAPHAARPPQAHLVTAGAAERHHYSVSARIRPLLFWIGGDDVGDAVIVKRSEREATGYSFLIGTDPERAPRGINRWGFIDEQIRGDKAEVVGVMTASDESSIEEAESTIHKRPSERMFNIIRGTVTDGEALSIVTSIAAPADYTYRNVDAILNLAPRDSQGTMRVKRLPAGTRPGFLVALAEVIRAQVRQWQTLRRVTAGDAVTYVYHGHLYQLVITRTWAVPSVRVGTVVCEHAISSRFDIRNVDNGELTRFSMTYAAEGPLAETLLAASFRPRWWLEVQLALDDTTPGPAFARGLNP